MLHRPRYEAIQGHHLACEALNFFYYFWDSHLLDGSNVLWVSLNAMSGHHEPKNFSEVTSKAHFVGLLNLLSDFDDDQILK